MFTAQNPQTGSINIHIIDLKTTDNDLLHYLNLHFDHESNYQERNPQKKIISVLDPSQDLTSAQARMKPITNQSSVLLPLYNSQNNVSVHFILEDKYIGTKTVNFPYEHMKHQAQFEETVPCKIEVETLENKLEVIEVALSVVWMSKKHTGELINEVEKFNFQEYQNEVVKSKVQAKKAEILSKQQSSSQSLNNNIPESKIKSPQANKEIEKSQEKKPINTIENSKIITKPGHKRTSTGTFKSSTLNKSSTRTELQSTSFLNKSKISTKITQPAKKTTLAKPVANRVA